MVETLEIDILCERKNSMTPKKEKGKFFRDGHDYLVAIVGAIFSAVCTGIVTFLLSSNVVYHDYLSYNSITNLVETYFVQAGLLESDILNIESPQTQLEKIANEMKEQKQIISDLQSDKEELLEGNSSVEAMKDDYKRQVDELTNRNQELEDEVTQKNAEIEEKNEVIENLKQGLMPPIKGTQVTALSITKSWLWAENSGDCWDAYGSDYSDTTNYITTWNSYNKPYCEYKTDKQYKRIHGYVASRSTSGTATIRIYADETVVWSKTIEYKEGKVEFDCNINGCEFLTINLEGNDCIFSDIYVE